MNKANTTAVTVMAYCVAVKTVAETRVAQNRDQRGEISSWVITVAVLAALAIAVGAIITTKVTAKANSIPTG